MIAGETIALEAKLIILTYVRHRGWRVFGFGAPPPSPDTIKFPKGTLLDDDQISPYGS